MGHVLVCPTRKEKKYKDLSEIEAIELWISAKYIASNLKKFYKTDSIIITIQDGEDSGQSVDHVHIHILPIIENKEFKEEKDNKRNKFFSTLDNDNIKKRTLDDMEKECFSYRSAFIFP